MVECFEHQIYFQVQLNKGKLEVQGVKKGQQYSKDKQKYLGNFKDFCKNYEEFARGQLDLKTMEPREKTEFDFEKALKFVNMKTESNQVVGFLNNLCN